jgi:glutamate 5-kinase
VKGAVCKFGVGYPVEIAVDPARPFARGLAGYAADDVRRLAGKKTSEIEATLGFKYTDEVIHRNDLVLLEEAVV